MVSTYEGYVVGMLLNDSITEYKMNPGRFRAGIPKLSNDLFEGLRFAIGHADIIKDISTVPRKLSDCEIDYYVNYGKTSRSLAIRRAFNKNICWQLPRRGTGFVIYNPDDLKRRSTRDKYGYDQIGTKETVFAMIAVAKRWHSKFPRTLLEYGDISRPGGVDTPDHSNPYGRQSI